MHNIDHVYVDDIEFDFVDIFVEYNPQIDQVYVDDIKYKKPHVKMTLTAKSGLKLTFTPQGYETNKNTVYIYGPLRELFPDYFKNRDLLPWQIAYLEYVGRDRIERFGMTRENSLFTTHKAVAYQAGYEKGKEDA